jgi:hypothetical protein
MNIALGKLEHLDPRKIWENEATDFTPWLAEHIELLGEALGLDLQLEQREAGVGDFSCDILAREVGNNRPVIIENQLERTDHGYLGQLLTYAGGLDAAIVVWISPEIRDEHRKALDWLNRHTDDQVDFFGVSLEAIRIDDSKPAAQFTPVALPNHWGKTLPEKKGVSERGLIYKEFFQALLDELREKKFTNAKTAQPLSWYGFTSGISGIVYGIAFSIQGLRSELHIDTGSKERNKAIFKWFFQKKSEIDAAMGESLEWQPLEERQASRICVIRPDTTFADAVAHGDELRKWCIDRLIRLKEVFGPRLKEALAATEPVPAAALDAV